MNLFSSTFSAHLVRFAILSVGWLVLLYFATKHAAHKAEHQGFDIGCAAMFEDMTNTYVCILRSAFDVTNDMHITYR